MIGHPTPAADDPKGESFCFERGVAKRGGKDGWADVWKRGCFAWEYKGKHADLEKAYEQLDRYRADLENPPLLVTCDLDRFEIHTSFQNTKHVVYPVALEELVQPEKLETLRAVFYDPEKLRPGRLSPVVTADAAKALAELAQVLRERGVEPENTARFLDRLIFCFFAEDIGLLPNEVASRIFHSAADEPELFADRVGELFSRMATGGYFGMEKIPHVNGGLFEDASTLELTPKELALLAQAARLDWSAIDPSIFGTLFERGLDPDKRSQLGAHYTSREDIETLVDPVVMAPLRKEWEEARTLASRLLTTGKKAEAPPPQKPLTGAALKKAQAEAEIFLVRFLERLESVKVLDPACGSGNFLYVTLRKLKDLESEVYDFFLECGFNAPLRLGVGPWQLYGIEINPYAHELAQMTVWIGYLQWLRQHGTTTWKEPILQAMSNIECKDAVLDLTDPADPKEPTWPKVDYIIGNPPFLGTKKLRGELGDEYVETLFVHYKERIPNFSDLCCYWFEKSREAIATKRAFRSGLLATQGIRGGLNREVLKRIKETGGIFWAIGDREWVLDGASVHVSMIGFDNGSEETAMLDGRPVSQINADLTTATDTTKALRLSENEQKAFYADVKAGKFEVVERVALELLHSPNPNGRPTSDVLVPWINGTDVLRRPRNRWVVDFEDWLDGERAARYDGAFAHVRAKVKAKREKVKRKRYRDYWWLHAEPCMEMRRAVAKSPRFLVTPIVSKHRVFSWAQQPTLPDHAVVAIATGYDRDLGVLHARVHEVWSRRQGTQVRERESGFRYTPTTCFETFPFPSMDASAEERIGEAARELDALRRAWLNPREWTKEEVLEFPGSVDGPWKRFVVEPDSKGIGTVRWPRTVPKDEECAARLAKRTLTNLYNQRPAWLDLAHRKLDEAVFDAYGWPADLSDEEILERLLALNLERKEKERGGL
ncbi:MAG: class I SAM-dependent DNA methyltransferase [Acidobacteria bacterium]|nr:class I SAM-dependent DNA methyltransferase [Acidobacteriota bacterium]